jgi:hypothetical protein
MRAYASCSSISPHPPTANQNDTTIDRTETEKRSAPKQKQNDQGHYYMQVKIYRQSASASTSTDQQSSKNGRTKRVRKAGSDLAYIHLPCCSSTVTSASIPTL